MDFTMKETGRHGVPPAGRRILARKINDQGSRSNDQFAENTENRET